MIGCGGDIDLEPGTGRRTPLLLLAGVVLAFVLLCLPGLGIHALFDPDEGYYPAAAAESLRHGHPLDLTLNEQPRWNKPPLAYALMQGAFLLFGRNEFAARLPSVLEGACLVGILLLATASVAGLRAGLLAAMVLATTLGHQVMSRAAHPEMGLVLGTASAELLLALWFVSPDGARPRWIPWTAGLAMGFGFLAKGPVTLALPALMLVAGMLLVPRRNRPSAGEAARAFGIAAAVALALASPWFLWMGARHGEVFWRTVFGQLGHYTADDFEHAYSSPLYFVPVLAVAFLPWTAFLPRTLRGLRRDDPGPAPRFLLLMALAAGTSLLFWSLSSSQLPSYGLVFLPPLAAVVGMGLDRILEGSDGAGRPLPGFSPELSVLVLLSLCLALSGVLFPSLLAKPFRGVPAGSLTPEELRRIGGHTLVASFPALLALAICARRGLLRLPAVALWGIGLLFGLASVAGRLEGIQPPARAFAALVETGSPSPDAPLAVYRKRLPSLSFYTGRKVPWPHTEAELAAFLDAPAPAGAPRWLVIRGRHLGAIPAGRPWTEAGAAGEWRLLRFPR